MKSKNISKTKEEMRSKFEHLIRSSQLKVTQPRLRVLEIIDTKKSAISQPDLEKIVGNEIDRVTLYRILGSFEEKGILHKVFDLNGTATYAICSTECTTHQHEDQHVHFICSACNSVFCLNEISDPQVELPSGFSLQSISVNAVGLCDQCLS